MGPSGPVDRSVQSEASVHGTLSMGPADRSVGSRDPIEPFARSRARVSRTYASGSTDRGLVSRQPTPRDRRTEGSCLDDLRLGIDGPRPRISITYGSGSTDRGLVSRQPTARDRRTEASYLDNLRLGIDGPRPRISRTYASGSTNRGLGCRERTARVRRRDVSVAGQGAMDPGSGALGTPRGMLRSSRPTCPGVRPDASAGPTLSYLFSPKTLATTALRGEAMRRGMVLRSGVLIPP